MGHVVGRTLAASSGASWPDEVIAEHGQALPVWALRLKTGSRGERRKTSETHKCWTHSRLNGVSSCTVFVGGIWRPFTSARASGTALSSCPWPAHQANGTASQSRLRGLSGDGMEGILRVLRRDEACAFRMIDMIRRDAECGALAEPAETPLAVAVRHCAGHQWHVAAWRLQPLKRLIARLPGGTIECHAYQGWVFDHLQHRYALGSRRTFMIMTTCRRTFKARPCADVVRLAPSHAAALRAFSMFAQLPAPDAAARRVIEAPAAFAVIRDGRVIAKADVQQRTDKRYEINEVNVDPDHRSEGLGAGVATAAAEWILAKSGIPVYSAFAQNAPSVLLAESLGFVCVCSHMFCTAEPKSDSR